jgi:VanZ family protein
VLLFVRIVFWSAAIFAFVMAVIPDPPVLLGMHSDKVQHAAAFITLAVLGSAAYPRLSRLKLMLALIAFGGLIEAIQLLPAVHRDSELSDWGANILGAAGTLICMQLVRSIRSVGRSN